MTQTSKNKFPGEIKYPNLFSPIQTNAGLKLKNRILQPPMIKGHANADGSVNQRTIDNYYTEALGGAAAICVMASYVRLDGRGFLGQLAIDRDDVKAGLADLAYAIKRGGALAGIQLFHAGAIANPRYCGEMPAISASEIPCFTNPEIKTRELTSADIDGLVDDYAAAAGRAKEAGFDYVMIHANHGSLPHQFLSPTFNHRTDEYGKDKLLFSERIYKRVREVVGDDFSIWWRMSAEEFAGTDEEGNQTGYSLDLFLDEYVPRYLDWGIDVLDVSAGGIINPEALSYTIPPMYMPRATNVKYAEVVRKLAVKKGVLISGVAKIMYPEIAEVALRKEHCDLISIGRPMFADPEYPNKAREGRTDEIRGCIACNWCCTTHLFNHHSAMCAVNPAFGRERDYAIKEARYKKRVYIAGGGVAGMEAARVLTLRGHSVTLFEASSKLGGILHVASAHPKLNTRDLRNSLRYLSTQMTKLQVDVRLNTRLDVEVIENDSPDVVIIATGAIPNKPQISGIDSSNVIYHDDYLRSPSTVTLGQNVVIIGGGEGAELAVSIRREGKNVTILEESDAVAVVPYMHDLMRSMLLSLYMGQEGVNAVTKAKVECIKPDGVEFTDADGAKQKIDADTVIIATGRSGDDTLYTELEDKVAEIHIIGDAKEARSVAQAYDEAAYVARIVGSEAGSYFPTGGSSTHYVTHANLIDGELLTKKMKRKGVI